MLRKHTAHRTIAKLTTFVLVLFLLFSPNTFAQSGNTGPCLLSGSGGQLFSNGENVVVTIEPAVANFTSDIYLILPEGKEQFIGTNRDAGAVVRLRKTYVGEELVFQIRVRETSNAYTIGAASRNPDRIVHAAVDCISQRQARVVFEDSHFGGDNDFNDVVFKVGFGETRPNRQLRRSIVMGPIVRPGSIGSSSDLLFRYNPDPSQLDPKANVALLKNSNTPVVRLWADWTSLQPNRSNLERDVETDCQTKRYIDYLDQQIITARKEGFKIILTASRFPLWLNYSAGELKKAGYDMRPPAAAPDDLCPLPKCTQASDSDCEQSLDPNRAGSVYNQVPDGNKLKTYWGRWIKFLVRRYGYSHETKDIHRYVDFLEVSNEPNLNSQMWPQKDNRGRLIMPARIALMFKLAQQAVQKQNEDLLFTGLFDEQHPTTLVLAGPGTEDVRQNSGRSTSYRDFTQALLRELFEVRFDNADPYFAWSVHNYGDILHGRDCDPQGRQCRVQADSKVNAAAWVRNELIRGVEIREEEFRYRWFGWPGGGRNPSVLITEGGARLNEINREMNLPLDGSPEREFNLTRLKARQADLVTANLYRMYYGPLSGGIALLSQYLTYTDPCSDAGTHDFIESCQEWARINSNCNLSHSCTGENGEPRRLYDFWSKLPTAP